MSKVYDKAFKVGVGVSLLTFLIFNVASFLSAYSEFQSRKNSNGLRLSYGGYSWGFPFKMYAYNMFTLDGVIANTVVIVFCSFILGFIVKSTWAETNSNVVSVRTDENE